MMITYFGTTATPLSIVNISWTMPYQIQHTSMRCQQTTYFTIETLKWSLLEGRNLN